MENLRVVTGPAEYGKPELVHHCRIRATGDECILTAHERDIPSALAVEETR